MNLNSKIILVGDMKLDKDYKNVLSYSENQMLALCNQKKIAEGIGYSFIEPNKNSINVQFSYATCINCDYIAFQNEYYSNKWFFAFVNSVSYLSENATTLNITIDDFSTWFSYWQSSSCFVLREHVNSDMIGENTVPESLETGDYVLMEKPIKLNNFDDGAGICIAVTELPEGIEGNIPNSINNIYSGLKYCIFQYSEWSTACQWADDFISLYNKDAKANAIVSIFMVPKAFALTDHATVIAFSGNKFFYLPNETTTYNTLVNQIDITLNTNINGYIPKNNKLFTYPTNYFFITNNAGTEVIFNYEDFINNSPSFKIIGAVTPGCSIKCIPLNYKKWVDSNGSMNSYNFGIAGAKLPICAWTNDTFINWLSENGVNLAIGIVSGAISIGIGALTGGVSSLVTLGAGASTLKNTFTQVYQHSLAPDQAKGNISNGDVNYSAGNSVFTCYQMGVKYEWAKRIDDYFTRFGYQVNSLKTPNIYGRLNYNYIQIGDSENIGYPNNPNISIPATSMEKINQIFRTGVTVWHNYQNLGNYNVDNSIIHN